MIFDVFFGSDLSEVRPNVGMDLSSIHDERSTKGWIEG